MQEETPTAPWFEDNDSEADDFQIDEYDITAVPNDFNVVTLFNFVDAGAVRIPGFQRNFVWDIKRASKLIESLILGLPVPQIFLYEEKRNTFLVIDGQQRMMSIYYFLKQRFPKKEKRVELRRIFDQHGKMPDEVLFDDTYFTNFKLSLGAPLPNKPNKFAGLNYATLGDYRTQLDLRPIRNVVVKQNDPQGDDSSMYEIFNRLNTGGINLRPQEIRASMYHSAFYDMLTRLNSHQRWRELLGSSSPDLHMKDIEIMLRGMAMLLDSRNYAPSMIKFLNQFSRKCKSHAAEYNDYLEHLFISFLDSTSDLSNTAFFNQSTGRFNIALFEATFTAIAEPALASSDLISSKISAVKLHELENDKDFQTASREGTTNTSNLTTRLDRARQILST